MSDSGKIMSGRTSKQIQKKALVLVLPNRLTMKLYQRTSLKVSLSSITCLPFFKLLYTISFLYFFVILLPLVAHPVL